MAGDRAEEPFTQQEQSPWREGEEEDEDETYDGPEPSTTSSADLHVRSASFSSDLENGAPSRLPLWLREQSQKSLSFKWIPLPIRQFCRFVNEWTKGPKVAEIQQIKPWFPTIQDIPLRLVDRFLPNTWHKALALSTLLGAWLLAFCLVLRAQTNSGEIEGYGQPQAIWCGANFWNGGNDCGIDGNNCRPFSNATFAFKCNANCASVKKLQHYAVGSQDMIYNPLVIGGPSDDSDDMVYRADSFICQAAIHAGVISNEAGGCGVLELTGTHSSFTGSRRNGIASAAFDAPFPKTYRFLTSVPSTCGAVDMRWPLLGATLPTTILLSLFVSSPALLTATVFPLLFFHVGLVSDRPNISDIPSLLSVLTARFLPAAFCVAVLYLCAIRPQHSNLRAQIERTVLWLGGVWVGALSNYTLDFIPIQRLTPSDIASQPGALPSLLAIVFLILGIAVSQIVYLRRERRLRSYLAVYAGMGALLLLFVALPRLNLRIHHYVLALLLVPGTRTQTRGALLWQGLLLGLFANGTARWGFDSVLQTTHELLGAPGEDWHSLLPNITVAARETGLVGVDEIRFVWDEMLPSPYDGVSVLVDDVERWRWYVGEGSAGLTWRRKGEGRTYVRFAYMKGSEAMDYTRAGVWDGEVWSGLPEGRSR